MNEQENVSERLPQSDDAPLKPAIAKLIQAVPETWQEYNPDGLTAIEDNALFLLIAAGMVERRGWFRSIIANHPTCFEVRFQATGEGGFAKAIQKATAVEYETWGDAWRAWNVGETKDVSPFRTETMKPQEWRLTDQGVIARNDLTGTNPDADPAQVFDFVLKRGYYGPGYWGRLLYLNPAKADSSKEIIREQSRETGQDWAALPRPPISGSGELIELRKIENPAGPAAVSLANWPDGADAFADAFAKRLGPTFEALSKSKDASLAQLADLTGAVRELADEQRTARTAAPASTNHTKQSEAEGKDNTLDTTNHYENLDSLQPAHKLAYLSFLYAQAKRGTRLEDRDAHDWLSENGIEDDGELSDYELPEFDTWSRYLRKARSAIGEQKYTPRTKHHPRQ